MSTTLACPECGFIARAPQGLGSHRRRRHGVIGRRNDAAEIAEKKRAYYEANRAEIAEKQRAYYEANRAEIAEKKRAYYEANRAEIAEKQRAYYEANRAEIAEKQRARIPALVAAAEVDSDWVEVEAAVDAAMSGTAIRVKHQADRAAASIEVMRRGGRSAALGRLGWSGVVISAWLAWWDQQRQEEPHHD